MVKKLLIALFISILLANLSSAYSQKLNRDGLEHAIQSGIKNAYPASVKIMGWDTIKKVQNSAQFSGAVVSPEGHILTAAHAIQPNRTYKVLFPDGKECLAIGLGRIVVDAATSSPDVAMIKIITKGSWPYAEMGWSSSVKKDEPCISIAYPETLAQSQPTVRFGRITEIINQWGFVQSTCLMEPGDSGGALYDYMGRLIALHSRINISEDANYEIPISLYRKYWTALNRAKTYTALPDTDVVKTDPKQHEITAIPELKNLNYTLGKSFKFEDDQFIIVSHIKDFAQKIKGTLVDLDGLNVNRIGNNSSVLISKSSCVGDDPAVKIGNSFFNANVIARNTKDDLVLLQIDQKVFGGVKINMVNMTDLQFYQLGTFLLSPNIDSIATVSILSSRYFSLPLKFSTGFLGAPATFLDGKVTITRLMSGSPAKDSLKVGDQLISINGEILNKSEDYQTVLEKYWPGNNVTLVFSREGATYTKRITLGIRPATDPNHPAEKFPGGKSLRRDGFSKVFAHDARVKAEDCGGPVFDTEGKFYGINIARFSRTTTLVMPSSVLLDFIKNALNIS